MIECCQQLISWQTKLRFDTSRSEAEDSLYLEHEKDTHMCLESPEAILRISDDLVAPFNLQMTGNFLEERRAREGLNV